MSNLDDTDRLTGKTLRGVYLVQEKIADGVMGAVYKAVHTALDAPFAVKVLRQDLQPDRGVVARFQREARVLSRLRHPNVVAITDFGQTEDGTLFVVMEYVTGKSLARVIAEEAPLPEHRVVRIGAQILAGLAEAHARQVLHGALTPKDVMIEARRDPPDSVKVLDFGVAGIQLSEPPASAGTRSLGGVASPAYLSPEQLAGGDVDARSDLYAVGAVLYEMLTKRLPFDPASAAGRGHAARQLPPRPSLHVPRPVSTELEELVMRALQPHPYERPESAAEMREELLRCVLSSATDTDEDCGPTVVLPRRASAETESAVTPSRATPSPATPSRPTPSRPTPSRATPPRATPSRETTRATPASATSARPARARAAGTTPANASTRRLAGVAARSTPPATPLSPAVLAEVERRALPILGPVAPFLVAKAGAVATTPEELCEIVASFIPSDRERTTFLAAAGTSTRTASTPARGQRRAPVTWDPELLERAQRALAAQIGPVARVVVRRAAAAARDPEQLVELLAREIGDDAGRVAFRRALEAQRR
jgi:serine/threonine-protein kinase